jgi:predicted peptidase
MKTGKLFNFIFSFLIFLVWSNILPAQQTDTLKVQRKKILVISSMDKTSQPSYLYLPPIIKSKKKIPLVVFLHTWSGDLEQRYKPLEELVAKRGWLLLAPNFRGRNDHPEACGSPFAQQDILGAISWVKKHYSIDRRRVYLVGFSGGGYLTLLMAMLHPKNFAAASAWCAISDLTQWYELHKNDQYGKMMRLCFGGPPGQSDSIAQQYRNRSPITYLSKRNRIPIDIFAGGYDSVVPPHNSINAFNALVKASGYNALSEEEINKAFAPGPFINQSKKSEPIIDPILGKRIFFRRQEGKYRITIFEGVHEWIPEGAMQWLDTHRK